ncbi:MAG: hypothetical protein ACLP6G_18985 [Terriglobales bacterium]
MKNPEFVATVVLAIIAALVIAVVPGDGAAKVKMAISYTGLIMLFLFGFMVLAGIASGKIDISQILSEKGSSGASMSRFQLMIFTFVISLSLFLIVVSKGDFPQAIPNQILELLGISATTYGVSKGIQATSNDKHGTPPAPPPHPPHP